MSEIENKETEGIILEAAKKVFIDKGLAGARMQEIADEAKINKSLLHYYYRTKEKLFSAVFKAVIGKVLPSTLSVIKSDISLFEKIEIFVSEYIDLLQKNPSIPLFVIYEMNRNPNGLPTMMFDFIKELDFDIVEIFRKAVNDEIQKGTIKETNFRHLFVNTISLCIFPFVGKPIIQKIGFNDDKKAYDLFLKERKNEVSSFIINSIKI